MGVLVKRRFVVYLQIGFLFVVGLYLLMRFDQLPTPTLPDSLRLSQPQGDGQSAGTSSGKSGHGPYPPVLSTLLKGVGLPVEPEATPAPVASSSSNKNGSGDEKDTGSGKASTDKAPTSTKEDTEQKEKEGSSSPSPSPTPLTDAERVAKARTLIPSILDPKDTAIDRLSCPAGIDSKRYGYLQASNTEMGVRYFFAINLRQCVDLLPRLMGSVMDAIKFLGPQHCALSIVEGNSDDGTYEVLELLKVELAKLGVAYYLTSSRLNPSKGDRIEKLSLLRSMALAPVSGPVEFPRKAFPNSEDLTELEPYERKGKDGAKVIGTDLDVKQISLTANATVVFLNDVAACPEDILELVHQRAYQGADMTCAMDWSHRTPNPLFYDVWVSRAANGDLFFDIPANGSWDHAEELFFNEPIARERYAAHRPFQVFACWNGAVAISAEPIASRKVLFRSVMEGECFQGEPQLFCKDMWWAGFGKIAVVPSINLEYEDKLGRQTKKEKGYAYEWIEKEKDDWPGSPALKIDWKGPPNDVKCMPGFDRQSWMPWNETLVDMEA